MIGRLGLDLRGEHIESFAIGVKYAGPVFGDFSERFAFFEGAFDGFVVDVGQVAYVEDFIAGDLVMSASLHLERGMCGSCRCGPGRRQSGRSSTCQLICLWLVRWARVDELAYCEK